MEINQAIDYALSEIGEMEETSRQNRKLCTGQVSHKVHVFGIYSNEIKLERQSLQNKTLIFQSSILDITATPPSAVT